MALAWWAVLRFPTLKPSGQLYLSPMKAKVWGEESGSSP